MTTSGKSSRREFLRGNAAAVAETIQSAAGAGDSFGEDNFEISEESAGNLLRLGRRAMACQFEAFVNAKQNPQAAEAAVAALDLIDQLEAQLTVYRDTSEISHINRTAHVDSVPVESRLFELLRLAAQIHLETAGAYDIAAGAAFEGLGIQSPCRSYSR